jgi:diacylglycerol kinase (ATP)
MKEEIWFIINPISGISNKKRIESKIHKFLDKEKYNYSIIYTEYREHGSELSKKAIENKIDVVCAVGGDGTVHEVATALIHSNVKLAIIPSGSGNGFAHHFQISENIKKCIEIINIGNFSKIDTALVNDVPFIQVAGIGYDAKVAYEMVNNKLRGLIRYLFIICRTYFGYRGVEIELSGEKKTYFMVVVANTNEFGNGFKISPTSNASDGNLELLLIKKAPLISLPLEVLRFLAGTSHKSKFVETREITGIELNTNSEYFQMDGEGSRNEFTQFNFKIVPKSLVVIHG